MSVYAMDYSSMNDWNTDIPEDYQEPKHPKQSFPDEMLILKQADDLSVLKANGLFYG